MDNDLLPCRSPSEKGPWDHYSAAAGDDHLCHAAEFRDQRVFQVYAAASDHAPGLCRLDSFSEQGKALIHFRNIIGETAVFYGCFLPFIDLLQAFYSVSVSNFAENLLNVMIDIH